MPRKSKADHTQTESLYKFTRNTSVKAVPDEEFISPVLPHPESYDTPNVWFCQDGSVGPGLLGIIGAMGGTAMVDEDKSSESGSEEEEEEEVHEIQEISALEQFLSILQKAHDFALAAEREQEKGRKEKRHFQQTGHELEKKGFCSVKDWLQKTSAVSIMHCLGVEPDTIAMLQQESEESEFENEFQQGAVHANGLPK
ncbi:hypothetical protein BU17DRAFT_69022 [Hysterangium stoloniferum]|nr:hypothetical protein BU17DRAFT_69022 [Hysterangium stoloniferum]